MDLYIKQILSRILFGKPIPTQDAHHHTIGKAVGLAVFASDALSSVAYATGEILLILVAAGTGAFHFSIPIALVIVGLLWILTISYRQTIFSYPNGGGAYVVSRENLGESAAEAAGAALLMDYVLTVAVSISSGVDQVISVFPNLFEYQLAIALVVLCFIMFMNLRGVKESGIAFAFPTYFFVGTTTLAILVGLFRWSTGSLGTVEGVEAAQVAAEPLTLFLILRAFSSGCAAVTGVEAISNGITAFKEPRSKNAADTMIWMGIILGFFFMGITFLAYHIGAMPSDKETVISQVARTIFNRGFMYNCMMAGTTAILFLASNTSFADFPRLCALLAGDGFLPRQLTYRSGRLVFSWGIVFLSVCAGILLVVFNAHTSALIPLYAIGVFMSFTLSQFGMVIHWSKIGHLLKRGRRPRSTESMEILRGWKWKRIVNAIGGVATLIVMIIFAVTKFSGGAWVTVILIPTMIWIFGKIRGHYKAVFRFLALPAEKIEFLPAQRMKTILLIDDVHTGTIRMIEFAKTLGHPWVALHVNFDEQRAQAVEKKWKIMVSENVPLTLINSPYRFLFEPVIEYISKERDGLKDGIIHVITGQLVVRGYLGSMLHSKNARGLYDELKKLERVIVTGVPYHLERRARNVHLTER